MTHNKRAKEIFLFTIVPFFILVICFFLLLLFELTMDLIMGSFHVSKKELVRLIWNPLSMFFAGGVGAYFFYKYLFFEVSNKFTKNIAFLVSIGMGVIYFLFFDVPNLSFFSMGFPPYPSAPLEKTR
jgi:hypothetical protein